MVPTNAFKRALRDGTSPVYGLWLSLANAYSAEICATAGFDWLLIDAEHAPNDLRSVLAHLQALAPYPASAVVRPPVGEVNLIKQLLDIGAQTLLIPMVETEAQVKALVAAMHYPPRGVRGVGSAVARASRWNAIPDYLETCGEQLCLLVQVETRLGLENLEAIASVPGIDGVFIGPADLSASLGHLGRPDEPEVQSAIEGAIRRIREVGNVPGILIGDPALAMRYADLGCGFVATGVDTVLLARAARELAALSKASRPSGPRRAPGS